MPKKEESKGGGGGRWEGQGQRESEGNAWKPKAFGAGRMIQSTCCMCKHPLAHTRRVQSSLKSRKPTLHGERTHTETAASPSQSYGGLGLPTTL